MKKPLAIIALMLAFASAFGQMEFGIKAGLNLAALKVSATIPGIGSGSNTMNNRTSFCAGMFMRTPLGAKGSFQPELMYSSQGGGDTNGSGEFKLDYLVVPLMFRLHANEMISLHAGPQVGFLLNAEAMGQSITKQMSSVDVALNFGLGFEFAGGGRPQFPIRARPYQRFQCGYYRSACRHGNHHEEPGDAVFPGL